MANDRDSSDDGARDEGAANDDARTTPPEPRESAAHAAPETPAGAKSTIEVVTADNAPPSAAARRPPRQIVRLGEHKPKRYLN